MRMTPFAFFRIYSHSILWTPDPGECTLSAEVFEARRTYQAAVTKEGGTGARVRGGPHRPGGGAGRPHRGVPAAGGVDAPQGPGGASSAGGRRGGGPLSGPGARSRRWAPERRAPGLPRGDQAGWGSVGRASATGATTAERSSWRRPPALDWSSPRARTRAAWASRMRAATPGATVAYEGANANPQKGQRKPSLGWRSWSSRSSRRHDPQWAGMLTGPPPRGWPRPAPRPPRRPPRGAGWPPGPGRTGRRAG